MPVTVGRPRKLEVATKFLADMGCLAAVAESALIFFDRFIVAVKHPGTKSEEQAVRVVDKTRVEFR